MSRYIDADRLIDDIRPFAEYDSNLSNKDWVRRFEIAIDAQPTADVVERSSYESMEHTVAKLNEALSNSVEVVRCKDCKWWDNEDNAERCTHEYGAIWAKSDGYCSYGERADT